MVADIDADRISEQAIDTLDKKDTSVSDALIRANARLLDTLYESILQHAMQRLGISELPESSRLRAGCLQGNSFESEKNASG